MGLTIHSDLHSDTRSPSEARRLVEELRRRALDLPFAEVDHDRQANDEALVSGERLLSAYKTLRGVKLWVITEADRSSTCCLLPEEY